MSDSLDGGIISRDMAVAAQQQLQQQQQEQERAGPATATMMHHNHQETSTQDTIADFKDKQAHGAACVPSIHLACERNKAREIDLRESHC